MTDEHAWTANKQWWLNYHKWRTPPAERSIEIAGHIGDRTFNHVSRSLARDPLAPIYATIDSSGGDPVEAMRCYEALRAHKAPVRCHVASRCSSAALLVLAGFDERPASPITPFVLHRAEYVTPRLGRNTAQVMRADAAGLDQVDEEMISILAGGCGRFSDW